jgi:hypothetical protein
MHSMVEGGAEPPYRRVSLSARPTRLAIAITSGPGWKRDALHVLESLSRFWGGAGDVIFPGAANLPAAVWRALEAFDADLYGYYVETFAAWRQDEPDEFERWVDETARRFVAEGSSNTLDQWREQLEDDNWLSRERANWAPDASVEERILSTTSPLRLGARVFDVRVAVGSVPGYRFADVVTLEPTSGEPVVDVDCSEFGQDVELLMASRCGLSGPAHREALLRAGVNARTVEVPASLLAGALEYAWTGDIGQRGESWLESLAGVTHAATPFGRSLTTCSWFGREGWPRPPFVFVVGDAVDDFALALLLSRVTQTAAWLPTTLLEGDTEETAIRALNSAISNVTMHASGERAVKLTSASLATADVERVRDRIVESLFFPDLAEHISAADAATVSPETYWRLWDVGVNQRTTSEAFIGGLQAGLLATPLASVCTPERGTRVGWMVDAAVSGHRVPTRSALDGLVAETAQLDKLVRPARDGTSFFSFSGIVEDGLPLELNLSRPRLALPTAESMFAALLGQVGLRAELSAAGGFAAHAERLWGTLDRLASSLSDPAESRMLLAYLSDAKSGVEPGVRLDVIRRRFLTFDDLMMVGELGVEETRGVVDDWATRHILRRGLVLGCDACRYSAWYDIGDVGASFTCQRCRQLNILVARAWKDPVAEPRWYYDLAEPVYQAFRGNVQAPLFCLRALKKGSTSFLFVHEMDVHDAEDDSLIGELDIWAIRDGRIIVGEATTTDDFAGQSSKKLATLGRIAEVVTADEVVLATTAPAWRPAVVERADKLFGESRVRLRLMTSSELVD